MKRLLIVLLLVGLLIVPTFANETIMNKGTAVYNEPALSVKETSKKITEVPTTAPTPIITSEPSLVDKIIGLVIPTQTPTPIKDIIIKPTASKDATPKLHGNKLTFEKPIQNIKVSDANDKNITFESKGTDNQIDLPVDVSKPGKIAIRIQDGDVMYVIRREV